jgi:signal transduction histidine kinase
MVTAASALADEVAVLRRRVADLQTACDEAQLSKAAMRLAIAGLRRELNGPLSVLVPRVDLMLQEAEERELPRTVLEDLAVLQRHLERLCRVAEVLAAAEPDRGGLVDLNAVRANPGEPCPTTEPEGTGLGLSIIRGIGVNHRTTSEINDRATRERRTRGTVQS